MSSTALCAGDTVESKHFSALNELNPRARERLQRNKNEHKIQQVVITAIKTGAGLESVAGG